MIDDTPDNYVSRYEQLIDNTPDNYVRRSWTADWQHSR